APHGAAAPPAAPARVNRRRPPPSLAPPPRTPWRRAAWRSARPSPSHQLACSELDTRNIAEYRGVVLDRHARRHGRRKRQLQLGHSGAHLAQRRSVSLLQVSRNALDHALGLPDEAACVLVFDG